jgi:hypothetical protein
MGESPLEVYMAASAVGVPDQLLGWTLGIKSKVGNRILAKINESTDHLDRYIECVEIAQLPGAYLCCTFYQRDMNDIFTRMGLYMGAGKGHAAGSLVAQNDAILINYKKLVAGHNLPGATIRRFFEAAKIAASGAELNRFEQSWGDVFLNHPLVSVRRDDFYVIAFSIQNTKTQESVISHEILHAHYYLDEEYREAVRRFWESSMNDEQRQRATQIVGLAYNTNDEDLVIDEFQAYLLQSRAQNDRMKSLVPALRDPLLNELHSKGIVILTV